MVLNITVCMCNLDNCWTKDTKKPKNPTTKKPGCQEQKQSTAHASCMQHHQFSSVHLFSQVWLFATPWTAARQASLSITNSRSLLKLMSISLVMPSNHLILCRPLLLLPSIFPGIRVFSSELALHIRWPKYWSFSFGISPSNEYSELIYLGWTGWISLQCKGSQECSSAPQFKSINSLALSFLYSPALTSIHDYWRNHSLD